MIYVAYREVYVAYPYNMYIQIIKRTVNQNKINRHQKLAWNKKKKSFGKLEGM